VSKELRNRYRKFDDMIGKLLTTEFPDLIRLLPEPLQVRWEKGELATTDILPYVVAGAFAE
jgi:hypothetical protein